MKQTSLATFKEGLRQKGFEKKAVISDEEMEMASRAFADEEGVLDTPAEELRYIEGLLNLPLGFIDQFKIIPAAGYERCACGRTPSALDITSTALKKQIHDKETIRDPDRIFEPCGASRRRTDRGMLQLWAADPIKELLDEEVHVCLSGCRSW